MPMSIERIETEKGLDALSALTGRGMLPKSIKSVVIEDGGCKLIFILSNDGACVPNGFVHERFIVSQEENTYGDPNLQIYYESGVRRP